MQLAQAALPATRKSPARPKRTIEIPNGWVTRPYQRDLWEYMAGAVASGPVLSGIDGQVRTQSF